MMQQNTDKNLKLRDDNIEISNKFQKLCEEFKSREEEVIRLTRQLDLEKQLAEATLKRTECQLNAEREIWNKEKEHYIAQQNLHAEEKKSLETNIKGLEEHLAMYSTKYDEFETTISKSNQVFDSYKVEMQRMSKHMTKFEQECNIWKERWLQSQQTINRITNENRACELNIQERDKKIKNLSDLCRSIQDERTAYIRQLKEEGITPVDVVHEPKVKVEQPPPSKQNANTSRANSHAKTAKEKELALLKKEMETIENQLVDSIKTTLNNKNEVTAVGIDVTRDAKLTKEEIVEDINKSIENLSKVLKKDITIKVIESSHPDSQKLKECIEKAAKLNEEVERAAMLEEEQEKLAKLNKEPKTPTKKSGKPKEKKPDDKVEK